MRKISGDGYVFAEQQSYGPWWVVVGFLGRVPSRLGQLPEMVQALEEQGYVYVTALAGPRDGLLCRRVVPLVQGEGSLEGDAALLATEKERARRLEQLLQRRTCAMHEAVAWLRNGLFVSRVRNALATLDDALENDE